MDSRNDQQKNGPLLPLEQGGLPCLSKTPDSLPQSTPSEQQLEGRTSGGTFAPGNKLSKGRKKGSKNKSTILREKMERRNTKILTREVPDIVKKAVDMAKDGDKQAMKLVFDEVHRLHTRANEAKGTAPVTVEINIGTLNEENMGEVLSAEYTREG